MHNGSAVTLFWNIFVDEIEQNHAVLFLLIFCIKSISHLQTPLIIIKSCLLIAICGRTEIKSAWVSSQESKARANVMHSVGTCGNEYNYY